KQTVPYGTGGQPTRWHGLRTTARTRTVPSGLPQAVRHALVAGPGGRAVGVWRRCRSGAPWRRSIVIPDRAHATAPGEQRIAAVAEQIDAERLVRLPLAIAVDRDRDRLGRLAGGKGQRPGLCDVVVVTRGRGAIGGAVRHRHGLVVGGRERDREREQGRLPLLALFLGHVADADARFVVHDRAGALTVGDCRIGGAAQIDHERLV